ncbi:MAG TPA: lipopolysaccharide kinase InaA family protein [Phycisphaerae bacterium]|nr:lipopolysaccharide kinase InaA family protein [Phycisphaerae bacterium]
MIVTNHMTIVRAYREQLGRAGLESVDAVLNCVGDQLAAWSRSTDTIRVDVADGASTLYVKRYHYPRWRHRLRGMLRGTFFKSGRAKNEFRALGQMRRLGIQAVRPVAYGERRVCWFLKSCFLITEGVPDAMPLSSFMKAFGEERGSARSVKLRREILSSLARQVRHMHDAGFVHRDLFWRNVLIRALPDERFEFYFLDASVGRRIRLAQRRHESIVGDLAALGAVAPSFCSKADQLRFLLEYLGADTLTPENRAWLRRVQTRSARLRPTELERIRRGSYFDPPMSVELA